LQLPKQKVRDRVLKISMMSKDQVITCFYSLDKEALDSKAKSFITKAIDLRALELMDSRNYI